METASQGSTERMMHFAADAPEPSLRAPTRTVLVVEDDPSLLNVLTRFLQIAGLRVLPAEDATAALAAAALVEGRFDMAVLDYNLPDHDGAELYDLLKERYGERPVCFISGDDTMGGALEGHEHAMCLTKPFSPKQLVELVRAFTTEG
ncbi:MAG TPA: response regulator [Gemmatimonadaceae bacterium]|nr:response regulator [Gemmatimonadaceae bacterium]